MSLTGHLRSRDSPIRSFFERELPNTRELVGEANGRLTGGRREPPLPTQGNASLVGTAADLLLNAALDPDALPGQFATAPSAEAAEMLMASREALSSAVRTHGEWTSEEWNAVSRHALLVASLVAAYRSPMAMSFVRDRLRGAAPVLQEYADRLWAPADEQDLIALATAVFHDHAFARTADRIIVNPTFKLSRRLGGADADLIVDGTLWDYKASGSRVVRREDVWQLAGYLLADADDSYNLRAAGISALRWRARHSWSAPELIGRLSGQPSGAVDLTAWRTRFEAMLPARSTPRPARRTPAGP